MILASILLRCTRTDLTPAIPSWDNSPMLHKVCTPSLKVAMFVTGENGTTVSPVREKKGTLRGNKRLLSGSGNYSYIHPCASQTSPANTSLAPSVSNLILQWLASRLLCTLSFLSLSTWKAAIQTEIGTVTTPLIKALHRLPTTWRIKGKVLPVNPQGGDPDPALASSSVTPKFLPLQPHWLLCYCMVVPG